MSPWGGPLASACCGGAELPVLAKKCRDGTFLGAGLEK